VVPPQIAAAMGAEPTDEQWRAISWPLEPCVLIAGAGSGKTSVMAARVVYLALTALGRIDGVDPDQGVLPGNVLCLTFTNKATDNLRLRVRRALSTLELAEGEEPEIERISVRPSAVWTILPSQATVPWSEVISSPLEVTRSPSPQSFPGWVSS